MFLAHFDSLAVAEASSEPVYGALRDLGYVATSTPKVCRMMAFWAVFTGFGPLFYIRLGSRQLPWGSK